MDTAGTMELEPDYRRLKAAWELGYRNREDALHLLFLAWMHWADPPFVTGMTDDPDAENLWLAIFSYFDGEDSADAEFLHVAGLMACIFPWGLGDEVEWASRATRMKERSLDLKPDGFSPEDFLGRSDYGDYFAHQARVSAAQ
ncbi:hypothetical protein [Brevundimonas subvibrioides]|uniref:Uncharacterized protein n=1 Tax=Brevundimonas subvibrioides (strain ATCC 15264 / DSM 4735 / LMG 14903 / NBRC 16000 / CB 81) TaxID=633149 RepID=D9QM91_BRESC|nr:hypothetical protein [Brevundimonas subvibrioides]ADL02017.1 hypothetical protein Bresu_2710 [Brevundimonas subvibrioides ATCC 15264]